MEEAGRGGTGKPIAARSDSISAKRSRQDRKIRAAGVDEDPVEDIPDIEEQTPSGGFVTEEDAEHEDDERGDTTKSIIMDYELWKNYLDDERRENQRKREQKRNENIHSDFTGDPDRMTPTPEQIERKRIRNEKEAQEAIDSKARHTHRRKKKSWEAWLENITKPIPDSKGGKGSFQHCINANQDKHNPGGWCKQIERKVEGKKKGRDEGEKEEVKISTYTKLRRIKDRLQAHKKKAKKVPTKEVKLPQTKIDEPKHWWDHSKVGTQGDIDQKTGRPWWEVMTEERERRKKEKEKKKMIIPEHIISLINEKKRKRKEEKEKIGKIVGATRKADKIEEPESDYYMDAGGNPQRKEKTNVCHTPHILFYKPKSHCSSSSSIIP